MSATVLPLDRPGGSIPGDEVCACWTTVVFLPVSTTPAAIRIAPITTATSPPSMAAMKLERGVAGGSGVPRALGPPGEPGKGGIPVPPRGARPARRGEPEPRHSGTEERQEAQDGLPPPAARRAPPAGAATAR